MSSDQRNMQEGFSKGIAALQQGNPQLAVQYFKTAIQAGHQDTSIWTALALAYHHLEDTLQAIESIEQALLLEPGNITAHIMKGDWLLKLGKETAANHTYGTAIEIAANTASLPMDIQREINRVEQVREQISKKITRHINKALKDAGLERSSQSQRFEQALSLLQGEREIYYQRPRAFYFPELPQIQFYATQQFAWRNKLEQATEEICQELQAVMQQKSLLTPYIHSEEQGVGAKSNALLDDADWSAFFLVKDGEVNQENAQRCPKTMAALSDVPFPRISGRGPMVLFSVLRPGAHIKPHHGFLNTRLICHLPLIVPQNCAIRVGNETRTWQKGELMVFDDSIEHEAWNRSDQTRVVLIFDIWRPELTLEEQQQVSTLLAAIDSYPSGA